MSVDSQYSGPNVALLSGQRPAAKLKRWFLATRPMFLAASLMPVLVGAAWGYRVAGGVDLLATIIAVFATLFVHSASNVYNDVSDDRNGTDRFNVDRVYPFTGGSQFIQRGIMHVDDMQRLATALYALALLLGLWLLALKGAGVLVFGVLGISAGILYSMPRIMLSGRGVGETVIGLSFGVIPVVGAAWLQSGVVDVDVLLVATPVSLWIAAVLLINEVPDLAADARANKRTLPVRLGLPATRRLYEVMQVAAAVAIVALVRGGQLPAAALVMAVLLLAVALAAAVRIPRPLAVKENLGGAIRATLTIHAVGSLGLAGLILWGV